MGLGSREERYVCSNLCVLRMIVWVVNAHDMLAGAVFRDLGIWIAAQGDSISPRRTSLLTGSSRFRSLVSRCLWNLAAAERVFGWKRVRRCVRRARRIRQRLYRCVRRCSARDRRLFNVRLKACACVGRPSKLWNLCGCSSLSVPVQMPEPASSSDGLSARSTSKGPDVTPCRTSPQMSVLWHTSREKPDATPCHTSPPQGVVWRLAVWTTLLRQYK